MATLVNADTSTLCNNYAVVRPLLRDGMSPLQLKKKPYYMVDSSYTIASNPNTMRDGGPCRNAVYQVTDKAEEEWLRKNSNGFNRTGGFSYQPEEIHRMRRTLDSRCGHARPLSAMASNGFNKSYRSYF